MFVDPSQTRRASVETSSCEASGQKPSGPCSIRGVAEERMVGQVPLDNRCRRLRLPMCRSMSRGRTHFARRASVTGSSMRTRPRSSVISPEVAALRRVWFVVALVLPARPASVSWVSGITVPREPSP